MNKFNLRFWGEILPGHDPERVRQGFGKLFGIEDPERLEKFFSGDSILLRRSLDRKTAAEYYAKLHKLGVEAELVKLTAEAPRTAPRKPATPEPRQTRQQGRAKRKAEETEGERQAAEQAATEKRRVAEEAARQRAEHEERQRREAEERASREAEEAERRRVAEEEAAQRRAKEEEEAARRREEEQRRADEEAARNRAEEQERKRLEAEAAARRKAVEEARKREAAEAAARQEAEQRKLRETEKARLRAEREAAARARRERAEQVRRRAEKKAAAEAERKREEKRQAEERAARLREEREEQKRRQAEEAARIKAEERRRRQEEQARARAELEEQAAQRRAMEAQAIARGAEALALQPSITATSGGVKTSLTVPTREYPGAGTRRRRQAGEPNLYSLEAFRNTAEIRERSARAVQQMANALRLAAIAAALLLIVGGRYLSQPSPLPITGPQAVAVNPGSGPALLVADRLLLHDRSGAGTQTLEAGDLALAALAPPMAFGERDSLYVRGADSNGQIPHQEWPLLRCNIEAESCETVIESGRRIDALAVHPLTKQLFIADGRAGELLKFDSAGRLLARAEMTIPDRPALRLDTGLLFMNSTSGPAIGIYRYEDENFGQQLDEVLLLPSAAINTGQTRVGNFIAVGQHWWVELYNPEDGNGDLFRFDREWQFLEEARLPPGQRPGLLANWNEKLLVGDEAYTEFQRFTADGLSEAPYESTLLTDLTSERERGDRLTQVAWRTALLVLGLLTAAALVGAAYQRMRSMVYRSSRERGAPPIDEYADRIDWVDPEPRRDGILKRMTDIYLLLCIPTLGLVVFFAARPLLVLATIIALAGPAMALALLRRDPVGHVGTEGKQLVLVDHRNIYNIGGDSRIQFRGPFLLIDDVVVYTGTAALPAFSPAQVQATVGPLRDAGVRVDRTTVMIKLLQGRHALATGTLLALFTTASALLLALAGAF